jgi:hypothetical protein
MAETPPLQIYVHINFTLGIMEIPAYFQGVQAVCSTKHHPLGDVGVYRLLSLGQHPQTERAVIQPHERYS